MRHRAHADAVEIVEEETGFRLLVISEDGDVFTFDIQHLAWDLAAEVDATLGAWRREGEAVRSEVREEASEISASPYSTIDELTKFVREKTGRDDLTVEFNTDAYDPSDPKHPDWHSVHADRYDAMRGDR